MEFRSRPCLFLGYNPMHYGYKCRHVSGHIFISRPVFNENVFPAVTSQSRAQGPVEHLNQSYSSSDEPNVSEPKLFAQPVEELLPPSASPDEMLMSP
ncbi:hypothetical protein J1N35_021227 [Gossypium stocksii]|uniref:Retroviral polymerase SH3-like domain-containing protein n=1 Tax=Gossypium stocksii TaxID=47602 RepID=A0A9D3VEU1_9ROSI|nr:hypothetical protein J1N35_021227 [Gossypium stocksii]